jgi:DNA-binding transcriptional MerR regulator
MSRLLLKADVARLLDISPASVREAAISGKLPVAATTERGVRLFSLDDVERFRREREAKRSGLTPSGERA